MAWVSFSFHLRIDPYLFEPFAMSPVHKALSGVDLQGIYSAQYIHVISKRVTYNEDLDCTRPFLAHTRLLTQMSRSGDHSYLAREVEPPSTPSSQIRTNYAIPPSSNRSLLSSVVDLFQQAKTNATNEFDQLYDTFSVSRDNGSPLRVSICCFSHDF